MCTWVDIGHFYNFCVWVWVCVCEKSAHRKLIQLWWHWYKVKKTETLPGTHLSPLKGINSFRIIQLQAKTNYIYPNHIIPWHEQGEEKTTLVKTQNVCPQCLAQIPISITNAGIFRLIHIIHFATSEFT